MFSITSLAAIAIFLLCADLLSRANWCKVDVLLFLVHPHHLPDLHHGPLNMDLYHCSNVGFLHPSPPAALTRPHSVLTVGIGGLAAPEERAAMPLSHGEGSCGLGRKEWW